MEESGQLALQRLLNLSLKSSCLGSNGPTSPKIDPEGGRRDATFLQRVHRFPRNPLYRVQGCSMSASRGGTHASEAGHGRNNHIPATTTHSGKEQGSTKEGKVKRKKTRRAHALLFSVVVCVAVEMTRSQEQFLLSGQETWMVVCEL